jgi:hypothetical protein
MHISGKKAVTNIKKYIPHFYGWPVGIRYGTWKLGEKKKKMLSKYVMKLHSYRHSNQWEIPNRQPLQELDVIAQ